MDSKKHKAGSYDIEQESISRSSGVGAAILKHYTGDDSSVFENPRFHPNMWCYRKTLSALVNHNTLEGEMDYD